MIIAVDFDGTLCENMWPEIGPANWRIIFALMRRQAEGDKIILWTCREGELLDEAVSWCINHRLHLDAVNANLPEMIQKYGSDCRKVYADEYWDDKSVIVCAGKNPQLMSRGRNGGFLHTRWEEAGLILERMPLWERIRAKVKAWWLA